jgi:arylsulfate sulfotransferase
MSIDDVFEWQYGQHAPFILPDFDNDPDTIDILLFDNGDYRFAFDKELQRAIANNEIVAPELYSRMVHYRINEREMTIEQIWQFGKELGEPYYSRWCGNARLLENGNRLGTFDRLSVTHWNILNTNFIEVDSQGNIVWEAYATSSDTLGSFFAYRMERLPLYTAAANNLRIGVPARNFIPEDKIP